MKKSLEDIAESRKTSKIYNHVEKQARKRKACRHFIWWKIGTKTNDLQKNSFKNLNALRKIERLWLITISCGKKPANVNTNYNSQQDFEKPENQNSLEKNPAEFGVANKVQQRVEGNDYIVDWVIYGSFENLSTRVLFSSVFWDCLWCSRSNQSSSYY